MYEVKDNLIVEKSVRAIAMAEIDLIDKRICDMNIQPYKVCIEVETADPERARKQIQERVLSLGYSALGIHELKFRYIRYNALEEWEQSQDRQE